MLMLFLYLIISNSEADNNCKNYDFLPFVFANGRLAVMKKERVVGIIILIVSNLNETRKDENENKKS